MMDDNFDVLPCGYVSFNDTGIITNCNAILEDWVDVSKVELIGKSVESIFTLATRIFYNTHFFPLIKLNSQASEIFLSLKNKNNHDIPVLANAQRIFSGEAGIIHCVFVRVEERKKFEQELTNAKRAAEESIRENKHMGELTKSLEKQTIELDKQYQRQLVVTENLLKFSKIISHDFQEPIRKIRIFTDMIAKEMEKVMSDEHKILCKKIDNSAERLRILTESLQQYVAIDSEKTVASVDLKLVIDSAQAKAVKVRQFADFEMELGKMPMVDGYGGQLELMFFHLIDNAIQFRDKQRKLRIMISAVVFEENVFRVFADKYKYADHIKISFEDNGMGFANDYKEYVFGLLSKLDRTTSGLGVGLSMVMKIIDNHFGSVSVTSEPGTGTRFEIQFPIKVGTY